MVSSLRRARRTMSSYACQNWRKSIPSQALMLGTTRLRLPSGRARSIAIPRLTCSGATRAGLPSSSANELFISGCAASALTSAYPIRCVKLTFPPRPRARWLLMTIRLSESSFAGTARTLVAVGTVKDWSMLATIRAATPRSTVVCAVAAGLLGAVVVGGAAFAGIGLAALVCRAGVNGLASGSAFTAAGFAGLAGWLAAGAVVAGWVAAGLAAGGWV